MNGRADEHPSPDAAMDWRFPKRFIRRKNAPAQILAGVRGFTAGCCRCRSHARIPHQEPGGMTRENQEHREGVEPSIAAWEAAVLPLHYRCFEGRYASDAASATRTAEEPANNDVPPTWG
jgi:hypothetical protein